MNSELKKTGFSLTEVLIAVGILSVGMVFIAGVFPAGIYFATVATERTIAAVAADEAFAKIRIYAVGDPNKPINLGALLSNKLRPDETTDFNNILPAMSDAVCNEFLYPTIINMNDSDKQYCWSAIFRRTDPNFVDRLVQVTVFICRKASPNLKYPKPPDGIGTTIDWPRPVKVGVEYADTPHQKNRLHILSRPSASGNKTFINNGYTIVDDATGRIYRVLERYRDNPATTFNEDTIILLNRDWDDTNWQGKPNLPRYIWVVPPPVTGTPLIAHGRYPCIAVYQKVISF